jgi:pimeloyl-ACP methyl ester carboxylesterase
MKKILLFFSSFLFITFLKGQTYPLAFDTNSLRTEFVIAKREFALYEKKHGRFVQTNNVLMHYLTWGKPTGIPLIWVHGSLTNGYEIKQIANSLTNAGYYLIAIDYYGHGQTQIPTHEVSLYHVADDIKVLMNKLNIKKAIIGGFSRGGYISSAFYDAYPERVLGLILEDGGSVSSNTYFHKLSKLELDNRINNFHKKIINESYFETQFEAYRSIYDTTEKGNQFEILSSITKMETGKWSICPGLMALFNMADSNQYRDLIEHTTRASLFGESMAIIEPKIVYRNLNVPLLILDPFGENDPFPFEKENIALQKQHPNWIKYISYKNTEHNIHYVHPENFISDLTDFLSIIKTPDSNYFKRVITH